MSTQETKKKKKKNNLWKWELFHSKCSRRIPRVEKNENSKIVDILFTRNGVELVSKIVVQGNIFNLNRWRKKEANEQNHHGFLLIAFFFYNADTTLEYENEQSPEVFQEAMIYSCAEVVVRNHR